jgi:hypothetical protein
VPRKKIRDRRRFRQRMPAIFSRLGPRHRSFDCREMRPRHVAVAIESLAFRVVHEIVPTVENDPRRIVEVRSEIGGAEEHGEAKLIRTPPRVNPKIARTTDRRPVPPPDRRATSALLE